MNRSGHLLGTRRKTSIAGVEAQRCEPLVQKTPEVMDTAQLDTVSFRFFGGPSEGRKLRKGLGCVSLALALLAGSGFASTSALAAPGSPVSSFGGSGLVSTANALAGVAVQSNGDIVAVGSQSGSLAIYRYLPDGSPDNTFGTGGVVTAGFPCGSGSCGGSGTAVAVESNGDIVAVSELVNVVNSQAVSIGLAVARLLPDGSLDSTFGNGGKYSQVESSADQAGGNCLLVSQDGSLLVGGFHELQGSGERMAAWKLTPAGQLDSSFGSGGEYLGAPFGFAHVWAITMAASGDYVLAGETQSGSNPEAAIVALAPQGTNDPGFGTGGSLTVQDGPNGIGAFSILARPDGSLLVGADTEGVGGDILHVTSGGILDTGFGSGGIDRVPGQHSVLVLTSMVADPQGRLVITGQGPSDGAQVPTSPVVVDRLNPDGTIDSTFGNNGVAEQNVVQGEEARGGALTLGPTGNIVVAGAVTDALGQDKSGFLFEVEGGTAAPPPPACPSGVTHLSSGEPWAVAAMTTTIGGRQCAGYWVVTRTGGVTAIGAAPWLGDSSGHTLNAPMIGIAATPSGNGYYLLGGDGGIFTFGDAHFYGSTGSTHLNKPVVGMAVTQNGDGYWLTASDGGIFTFGTAPFYGSMGAVRLNQPVVGISADNQTGGYWLVAADGGMFTFNAPFYGSMGAVKLNQPVVGMTPQPGGQGYRLVAGDGGVFDFGNATYYGSLPGESVHNPQVTTIASSVDGGGYYLINGAGTVWAFGDAPYLGNA